MENVWQSLKNDTNCLLDYLGAARNLFLCTLIYYTFLWNHTVGMSVADGTTIHSELQDYNPVNSSLFSQNDEPFRLAEVNKIKDRSNGVTIASLVL